MRIPALALTIFLSSCASPPLYTGFRGLASINGSCESGLSVEKLCANYSATESLKKDHHVVRAKQFCEKFYYEALRSADLLCAYIKDLDGIMNDGEGKDSPNVSARGKQLHSRYVERAQVRLRRLQHSYKNEGAGGTLKALEELSAEGKEHLKQELDCQAGGMPGAAPSFLVLGLVKKSKEDQTETLRGLETLLQHFGGELMLVEERPMKAMHGMLGSSLAGMEKQQVPQLIKGNTLEAGALVRLGRAEYPVGQALDLYERHTASRGNTTSEQVANSFRATKGSAEFCQP